jgi:hypothetical protein
MNRKRSLKKGDVILVLVVAIVAIVPLLWGYFKSNQVNPSDSLIAVITRDGKKMAEIDLNKVQEPQYFHYDDGIEVTIIAEHGQIRFQEAACPDKICVKTGILTKPGDRAVCLPSKTIVTIQDPDGQRGIL